jgi:hypothetical protein
MARAPASSRSAPPPRSVLFLFLFSCASTSPSHIEARACLVAPRRGRRWQATSEPRRHPAMAAVERARLRPHRHRLAQQVRLVE